MMTFGNLIHKEGRFENVADFSHKITKKKETICSRGFSPAREFSQTLLRFSTDYGGTDSMFYFFYKIIIFFINKEKDDIRSVYCKCLQLILRSWRSCVREKTGERLS